MAHLPTVAIIGRPNTGKSTLYNRLLGRRVAIVSDVPGTTRDHVAGKVESDGIPYLLIDTGGMGGGTSDKDMEDNVHAQSVLAIEHADLILFTVNSREELTSSDFTITDILRKRRRQHVPVLLVVTKCDNPSEIEEMIPRFHELGIAEEIIPVSAPHRIGTDALEGAIARALRALHLDATATEPAVSEESSTPRIAIIGRPNVGKSSFVNALMSDPDRSASPRLVSDIPGTTRDATDTVIRREGKEYIFIDTAGLRKSANKAGELEGLAVLRTVQALHNCDIALLIIDATQEIMKQDKRIARMAMEEGKGLVIAVNKTDLLQGKAKEEKLAEVQRAFLFCRFSPIFFCSALSREGILKVFDVLEMVQRNRLRRIATKDLHRWFSDAVAAANVGDLAKSKHITQAEDVPPTFVLFVKDPKAIQLTALRFLDRKLRETFGFEGTPVRWITKASLRE